MRTAPSVPDDNINEASFPLSVFEEGIRIFEFLGAQEVLRSSVVTCRTWNQLQKVPTLWENFCQQSQPDVAAAIARYEPHGGPGWRSACYALLRAGLLSKHESSAPDCLRDCGNDTHNGQMAVVASNKQDGLICPGCGVDMVADLLKLFEVLDTESKGEINMLEKAEVVEDVYQHDDRSALRPDLFRQIVQESCSEYLKQRGKNIDGSARINVAELLEYFRNLLFGDGFKGEHIEVVRHLRPWSTAATHNLVRLLGDPMARCECTVPPPPALVEMWMNRDPDNDLSQPLLGQPL